jgi:hypothetical protein
MTRRGQHWLALGTLLVAAMVALVALGWMGAGGTARASSDLGVIVPTKKGQTWYVCQGYNTNISHRGGDKYGLDLIPDRRAVGTTGCRAGYNAAQHQRVYTPVSGTISWKHFPGGLVCIKVSSSRSIKIGHMKTALTAGYPAAWLSTPVGSRVSKGSVLGYVATANSGNGGVPHIHIGMYANASCNGTGPIPFATAYGAALHGTSTWNLTSNGSVNQWSGKAVSR